MSTPLQQPSAPSPQQRARSALDAVFGMDLRSLALFRALLSGVLIFDLANRALDLRVFYTDDGVMPRLWAITINGASRVSLHFANGEAWFISALFGLEIFAALGVFLGWHARRSLVLLAKVSATALERKIRRQPAL